MTGKDIICIVIAYLLGGVCTGYYLVRLKKGQDIRDSGSGGVGARNVGRILGTSGFVATLLGDAIKGALAVALALHAGISGAAVSLVVVAVIAGHVWPLFLQFRGGRGIATAIGAYLIYDPRIAGLLPVLALAFMVLRRGATISGLMAFLFLPVVVFVLDGPGHEAAALAGASAIILFAHRERIRRAFSDMHPQKEV